VLLWGLWCLSVMSEMKVLFARACHPQPPRTGTTTRRIRCSL
jgi:hypothetical protein